ncbi:hypothetical protein BC2230_60508 [Burkholderia cepacia]
MTIRVFFMDLSPNRMMSIEPAADWHVLLDAAADPAERRCGFQKAICSVRSARSGGGMRFKQ